MMRWAYSAGLFDGEGTVTLVRHKANENRSPKITVPSTTKALVFFFKHAFGGTVSTKRTYKKNHSESYAWSLGGNRAINVLRLIVPYLLEPEKRRRALLLLNNYKSVTPRNGRYSAKQIKAKRAFEREFFRQSTKVRT